ncbi:MAG: SMP-30/gluconolactonase/LRE family protein [Sphaerotilus natans subsp. sulfidivorans]|uniref:SMP-30/gluconolactonase/LRE family protein n=1 Tax=Sphaerotilus sulfidivorans TaxID=639200 RepID=UPI002355B0D0|nr:SMP-30/gluconolactonase/LRE family protein [Sphaerotilus sulfidivorans]MCK6402041.1 SMP-30/gluconolactonase/LRE family protein [Sphaerotilus sulfidivorans]
MTLITVGTDALLHDAPRMATGENPIWDDLRQCWWCIDIPAGAIWQADAELHNWQRWQLPHAVGCLVLQADGRLAVAGVDQLLTLDLGPDGAIATTLLARVPHARADMRCNDGRCDRQGRWLLSSMVSDLSLAANDGRWWQWAGGKLQALENITCRVPNGSALSPDGRVFYSSDTHPHSPALWRQAYDPQTGRLQGQREPVPGWSAALGRPDGATVDADGGLWVCGLDHGRIARFTPDGRLDQVLQLPLKKPTMCAFGGPDGRTLLVTSLSRGPQDLTDDPHGGQILALRPGHQGLPEPRLARPQQQHLRQLETENQKPRRDIRPPERCAEAHIKQWRPKAVLSLRQP